MGPYTIEPLSDAFARALSDAVGLALDAPALPALVERVSRKYLGERQSLAKAEELAARALFFLPRDAQKVVAPIGELSRSRALPERALRVLDVGAGVGASALGAMLALHSLGATTAELRCVDEDRDALALLRRVFDRLGDAGLWPASAPKVRVGEGRVETPFALSEAPSAPWDLVLLSNVLTEALRAEDRRLEVAHDEPARAERVSAWISAIVEGAPLAEDGALIVVEPATQREARVLQRARTHLEARGLFVFAPCTHGGPCPLLARDRDWCHEDLAVDLPSWLRDVARGAGLRYQGLTYSYLTVRRTPGRLAHSRAGEGWVSARLVSAIRDSKGKREAFLCAREAAESAAPEPMRAMQLDRTVKGAAPSSPRLAECGRGEIVALRSSILPSEGGSRTVRLGVDDWCR